MLIILEGVDGSGKSVLAKQFVDKGMSLINVPRTPEESVELNSVFWRDLGRWSQSLNIVMDRSFISDFVYTHVMRPNGNKWYPISYHDLAYILPYCRIVYCNTPDAFESSMKRGETNVTSRSVSDELRNTYDVFLDFIDRYYSNVKHIDYDYTKDSFEDLYNELMGE